jgi:hypothetical protein
MGGFQFPKKAASVSVTDSISLRGLLETTSDTVWGYFEILLGKQAPLRARSGIPPAVSQ